MEKKGKLLLNVPYREKEEAKALGAWWNPEIKKWYATDRTNYHRFLRWLPKGTSYIVFDAIYLAVAKRACYRCNHLTTVVGFSNPNYISFYDYIVDEDTGENVWENPSVHKDLEFNFEDHISLGEHFIYNRPEPLPTPLLNFLKENFNYKKKYSKTKNRTELANCCEHCDALQGDHFLFDDFGSPFWPQTMEEAREVDFFEIELDYDLPFQYITDGMSTQGDIFESNATFTKIDFGWG